MDRNIITVMSGQIVDFFDRDFRELYAISRELNLFKEFSISKRNTAASTRVTVPTRPALPATSRFQVSLGDKGTLKVPAHKYHNPKYLLALGNLPDDISSPDDLINKMVESNKKYAAEGNPVEEDSEKLQEQTPSSSLKGNKGIKLSCVPSKRKRFTFKRKSKQKGTGKDVGGEVGKEDPGPSATTKLTPPTNTIEDIAESPEEPTAETSMSEKTKHKKKTKNKKNKSSQSEDQGIFNHLLLLIESQSCVNVLSFSLDFCLIMMFENC